MSNSFFDFLYQKLSVKELARRYPIRGHHNGRLYETEISFLIENNAGSLIVILESNASDMKKTMFIAVEMEEASVKFRAHGVGDDPEDMALNVWAGVLPLSLAPQAPVQDEAGNSNIPLPDYVRNYHR